MSNTPVSSDRAQLLDALRGFAVLGILLANIQHFSGWYFLGEAQRAALPLRQASGVVEFLIAWLVDGKFYSLFSLLFGIGFAVLLTRAGRDGRDFTAFFRRRLTVLLAIGLAHAVLIWYGDILTLYALLGFSLLWFRHRSDAALLRWILVLFALPIVQYAIVLAVAGGAAAGGEAGAARDALIGDAIRTFATGTWPETALMNLGGLVFGRYPDLVFTGRPFKVLATFLIGLWIGRRGIWAEPHAHLPLLRRVAVVGLAVGLPLNLGLALLMRTDAYYGLQPLGLLQALVYGIGVPALALGYAASFTLLHLARAWRRVLGAMAPAGRLALTNYLAHSVIGSVTFYGWGFGRFGSTPLAVAVLIAVAIFAAQVVLSALWLRAFRFGPAEWLWRSLTYRRPQPMRGDFVRPASLDTPERARVT